MQYWLLLVGALSLLSVHPTTETRTFSIVHKGDVIGELVATKTYTGSAINYTSASDVSTRIVMRVNVNSRLAATFQDGRLVESSANVQVNNRSKANSLTRWTGQEYAFYEYGEQENTIASSIQHSAIMLFFEEPADLSRIYAEQEGTFHTVRKVGEHSYQKVTTRGRANTYHYQNGRLTRGELTNGLVSFDLVAN